MAAPFNNGQTLTVTGGTFTGNTAEGDGSGIDNFNPIHAGLTVTGGTFTGNTAKSGGGMPKMVQLRVMAASRRPRTPRARPAHAAASARRSGRSGRHPPVP